MFAKRYRSYNPANPYLQPSTANHPTPQTALPIFCNQQVNGSNPLIGSKRQAYSL